MNEQELNDDSLDEIDITTVTNVNHLQNTDTINIKDDSQNDSKSTIDPNHINYKLPTRQFYIVLISLIVVMIMTGLDITVVASALPEITTKFNSRDNYTTIIIAYLIGNTSLQPTFGKLADIFGKRPTMIFGLCIFLISSIVSGASTNFIMIIISRIVQGVGSGCLCAMANIICSDIVSVKKRGIYLEILNSVFSVALAIGPFVGGFFIDIISWQWAFYFNVPLCLIAMLGIGLYVKIPNSEGSFKEKIKRIDFVGTYFLIVTLVCLILALNWGGSSYYWSSPFILGLFATFLIMLFCFIIIEYKIAREPIIPFPLFRKKNILLCIVISFLSGSIFITFNNTFSMLYQDGRGFSAMISGLRIIPSFLITAATSIGSSWLIQKYGHIKDFLVIGSFLLGISCYCLSLIREHTPYYVELFIFLFYGICITIPLQFSLIYSQISAPIKLNAIATAVTLFFRMIGGVIGVAVFGMLIKIKFIINYRKDFPHIRRASVNDLQKLKNGPHYYVEAIRFSYCATFIPATVIMFLLSLLLKRLKYLSKIRKSSRSKQDDTPPIILEEEISL